MLEQDTIDSYVGALTTDQAEAVQSVRRLLLECCPSLTEEIDQGKWYGGLLTYKIPNGMTLYALGPRSGGYITFHMMPYYGSTLLQERHGATLKPLLSGKSCIRFKRYADVPESVLRDILMNGTKGMMALHP